MIKGHPAKRNLGAESANSSNPNARKVISGAR
jgi:hypothetical protein